jgi:hypothetical protein
MQLFALSGQKTCFEPTKSISAIVLGPLSWTGTICSARQWGANTTTAAFTVVMLPKKQCRPGNWMNLMALISHPRLSS